jgi:predicted DNA-binding ribbon-helix-helix protein
VRKKYSSRGHELEKALGPLLLAGGQADQKPPFGHGESIERSLISEMQLTKPDWADFSMERVYWAALGSIARSQDLSMIDFVTRSKERFPSLLTAEAVKLSIVRYYQRRVAGQRMNIHTVNSMEDFAAPVFVDAVADPSLR